jgi:hypothetical protein
MAEHILTYAVFQTLPARGAKGGTYQSDMVTDPASMPLLLTASLRRRSSQAAAVAGRAEPHDGRGVQVRLCRYRFPPSGDLGHRGVRGAVGLGYRFTV